MNFKVVVLQVSISQDHIPLVQRIQTQLLSTKWITSPHRKNHRPLMNIYLFLIDLQEQIPLRQVLVFLRRITRNYLEVEENQDR